jgi:hypothetical protein
MHSHAISGEQASCAVVVAGASGAAFVLWSVRGGNEDRVWGVGCFVPAGMR